MAQSQPLPAPPNWAKCTCGHFEFHHRPQCGHQQQFISPPCGCPEFQSQEKAMSQLDSMTDSEHQRLLDEIAQLQAQVEGMRTVIGNARALIAEWRQAEGLN